MGLFQSFDISASGMTAERFRLDIIAQNINNADNVASTPEDAYKRQMVVFGESKSFKKLFFEKLNSGEIASFNYVKYKGVEAKAVVDDQTAAEPVYDPTHPLADERGYIYESNVDVATEQLDAMEAENMFSANMAVFEVVKSMASKALTLGKG